jgi:hypothetical protein
MRPSLILNADNVRPSERISIVRTDEKADKKIISSLFFVVAVVVIVRFMVASGICFDY